VIIGLQEDVPLDLSEVCSCVECEGGAYPEREREKHTNADCHIVRVCLDYFEF
jgi:hypothetical protein